MFLISDRANNEFTNHFTQFNLYARGASSGKRSKARFGHMNPSRTGRFQLFDDELTEFNADCVNMISQTDDIVKSEVQVMWVAPASGSGCVALSGMVYEHAQSWYADEARLTKILCEGSPDFEEANKQCCACDEAKYEVGVWAVATLQPLLVGISFDFRTLKLLQLTFEGIWSNETHPRDYPFAVWLTHFSDVIGASHESNFSFWGENHIATDGFRSMAELGSVRLLETELRAKGPRLRTLIKAAGLWYPDVNTNTTANFRTDRIHHKLSVVSMFGPSPDWVVGVSGLNLCQQDCTWKDSMDIDLYPWDAGTDNGITYMVSGLLSANLAHT